MQTKFKHFIIPNEKLIVEFYFGNIYFDDYIGIKKYICMDINYNPNYNVIMDFRGSALKLKKKDFKKVINFLTSYKKIKGNRKAAFVTENPYNVAQTAYFIMNKGAIPIFPKTFSSMEAALQWLFIRSINAYDLRRIKERHIQAELKQNDC